MLKIELPVFLYGKGVKKIADVFLTWWLRVQQWLEIPLIEIDPRTCTVSSLDILALSRGVKRFSSEPLSLYRLRVEFAYINANDAGSVAGLQRIFQRLGIGYIEIDERIEGQDPDIIRLQLSDSQLSQNQDLLQLLIREYGRTCRRYQFDVITPVSLGISADEFGHSYYYDEAS